MADAFFGNSGSTSNSSSTMDDSIIDNSRSAINSDNALNSSSTIIDNEGAGNSGPTGRVISRCGGDGSCVPKTSLRSSGIDCSNESGDPPETDVTRSFSNHTSTGRSGSYRDGSDASPCSKLGTCRSSSTRRRNSSRICRSSNNRRSRVVPDTNSGAGEDAPCTFYYVTKEQKKAASAPGRHTPIKKNPSSRAPGCHLASPPTAAATWVCGVAGCGARFRKKAHAERHGAVHTAERPYSCACCSASFKRSEHLRRHCYIVHHNAQPSVTGSRSSFTGTRIAKSETSLDNDSGVAAAVFKERSVGDQLELADKICVASCTSGVKSSARESTAVETGNRREVETKKAVVGRPADGSHPAGLGVRVSPEVDLLQHASDSHSRRSPAGKRKSTDAKEIAGALAVDTSVPVNRGVQVGGDSIGSLPICADVGVACSPSVSGSRDIRVAAASNVCDVSAAAVDAASRCCGASPAEVRAAAVEAVPGATAALAHTAAAASTGQQGMELREEVASAEIAMGADSDVRPSSAQQAAAATPVGPPTAAVRRPFACEKCGRTFVLKQHLTRHAKCHIGRYACKECDAAFAKKQQLRLHLLEHLVSRIEEERIEEERVVDISIGKERCGIDEIEETPSHREGPVDRPSEYEEELRRVSPKVQGFLGDRDPISERKRFLCPHKGCGATFTSLDRLYIHLKRVSTRARDYECETCGQAFLRFSALVAHRRAAHPANVHVCTVCSKRFSRVTRLREHIRTRHDENENDSDEDSQRATADGASCLCPVPSCGLAFATVSNMRAHYRVKHMQLRGFKCETCGAAFGFKAVLRRHVARVHGGNLETGAAAFAEARIEAVDGSQSTDVDARAAASTGSEGKPRSDNVVEGREVHPSSRVHATVSRARGSRFSVRTGDHLLVDGNSLPNEERLAPHEHTTQIKAACCSGFSVGKTVHQREEQTLRQSGRISHHDETKHTDVSSATGVCSGGMRGQSSAATEGDFPAGQTKEDIHLPKPYRSLTDGEWIVDAVRLNLLPVAVEGQL